MRGTLAAAIGAVLLIAVLVVTAPAALLDSRISAASGGRMRLANATGTLWNGSGELVAPAAGTRQSLHWRLDPWPLLRGEIRAQIGSGSEGALNSTLVYGRDRFELKSLDFSIPVESLLRAATAAKIAQSFGGNLSVHVDHLLQLADTLDAQLSLQWDNASVPGPRLDTRIALGAVRVDLSGRGAELSGPVRNSGGEVSIDGELSLAAAGAAKLDATLRPRGATRERSEMVAAALSTLGASDGQGGYRLRWSGSYR